MKKVILSIIVIFAFIAYAVYQRFGGAQAAAISQAKPSNNTNKSQQISSQSASSGSGGNTVLYKDGSYTGNVTDAYYGNLQVKAIIQKGKIADVQFLLYPSDRETSKEINAQAMPSLKIEAIQAQKAQVDVVSGATQTSEAFVKSLQSALDQAKS